MPAWSHEFEFTVGDRVRIAVPAEVKEADAEWAAFDGRFGVVGKILFETQQPPYPGILTHYRVDLETAPRGKGHIRWCAEGWLVGARKKRDAQG